MRDSTNDCFLVVVLSWPLLGDPTELVQEDASSRTATGDEDLGSEELKDGIQSRQFFEQPSLPAAVMPATAAVPTTMIFPQSASRAGTRTDEGVPMFQSPPAATNGKASGAPTLVVLLSNASYQIRPVHH
mmetsp:Transcript_1550/g.3834  ORF Transcript_1550/g.3834 Transcript_1550/m.3834 type:complete len:130 (+) Transcript_1550:692-1081(+)|eukprot:CAMPEP_0116839512 /NCGR_PEP_ID=MMETSP0418-20121206/9812_1 /TAXON_ID=1158023 /ORGANISM="Astrosyne radiata, Strain 13vi08-1A" /LENGTH=129 /DNA_ID=CAMNT_0004469639 /DNA_START=687 /DNA_END=1076 /DNA_ORIENTATION=-